MTVIPPSVNGGRALVVVCRRCRACLVGLVREYPGSYLDPATAVSLYDAPCRADPKVPMADTSSVSALGTVVSMYTGRTALHATRNLVQQIQRRDRNLPLALSHLQSGPDWPVVDLMGMFECDHEKAAELSARAGRPYTHNVTALSASKAAPGASRVSTTAVITSTIATRSLPAVTRYKPATSCRTPLSTLSTIAAAAQNVPLSASSASLAPATADSTLALGPNEISRSQQSSARGVTAASSAAGCRTGGKSVYAAAAAVSSATAAALSRTVSMLDPEPDRPRVPPRLPVQFTLAQSSERTLPLFRACDEDVDMVRKSAASSPLYTKAATMSS